MLGQISRFGLVGIVATVVHVLTGLGLNSGAGMRPLWANLIAFCCALVVSYLGQTRLTFPGSASGGGSFTRFTMVVVGGLGLNQSIVWVVTSAFAGPYWLALAVIVSTVPGFTFLMLKFWALRH